MSTINENETAKTAESITDEIVNKAGSYDTLRETIKEMLPLIKWIKESAFYQFIDGEERAELDGIISRAEIVLELTGGGE